VKAALATGLAAAALWLATFAVILLSIWTGDVRWGQTAVVTGTTAGLLSIVTAAIVDIS
jgi:hypothetical protein